jgi:hypothetical protein
MWLSIDPGPTTGYCEWSNENQYLRGDAVTSDRFYEILNLHLEDGTLRRIVIEEFRLYAAKATAKIGSNFPEVGVVYVCEYLCRQKGVPVHKQSASLAKTGGPVACKATHTAPPRAPRGFGPSWRHVRDAYLHGAYWAYFTAKKKE